jgi:hypothetical protein
MIIPYHVDTMAPLIQEHHAELLREAQLERLVRKQNDGNKPINRFDKVVWQFIARLSVLRTHVTQIYQW